MSIEDVHKQSHVIALTVLPINPTFVIPVPHFLIFFFCFIFKIKKIENENEMEKKCMQKFRLKFGFDTYTL